MSRVEQIGDAPLYLGNCLEILPTLAPIRALVTDPPFSIPHNFAVQEKALTMGSIGNYAKGRHPALKIFETTWPGGARSLEQQQADQALYEAQTQAMARSVPFWMRWLYNLGARFQRPALTWILENGPPSRYLGKL